MTEFCRLVAQTLSDLLLKDIRIYDFRDASPFYDYQIIASATNERQVLASIDKILAKIPADHPVKIEGRSEGRWILIDLQEVIVHVMHQETRSYYQIEKLFIEREEIAIEGVTREL